MGPLEGNWSNVAVVWRTDAADITTQIWPSWKWRAILDFSRANWYDVIHRVILRRISLNPRMEDKTHILYYNSEENPYEMAAILKMAAISIFFSNGHISIFSLSQTLSFLKVSCLLPKRHNFFTKLLDYKLPSCQLPNACWSSGLPQWRRQDFVTGGSE